MSLVSNQINFFQLENADLRFLKDPNKIKRKNLLKKIRKSLEAELENFGENSPNFPKFSSFTKDDFEKAVQYDINLEAFQSIVNCMCDDSEINRELATCLIMDYLKFYSKYFGYVRLEFFNKILPVLVNRLGDEDIFESCEEIRTLQLEMLQLLINFVDVKSAMLEKIENAQAVTPVSNKTKSKTQVTECERILTAWLTEILQILCKTCQDDYHVIRKLSHDNVKDLIHKTKISIHLQAESLLNPILKSFTHQHSKIRVSAVEALVEIIMHWGSFDFYLKSAVLS